MSNLCYKPNFVFYLVLFLNTVEKNVRNRYCILCLPSTWGFSPLLDRSIFLQYSQILYLTSSTDSSNGFISNDEYILEQADENTWNIDIKNMNDTPDFFFWGFVERKGL